jgi:hypothetical protein
LQITPPSPAPSHTLLSAQEASGRLREIVEGFFFRRLRSEDGKRIGRLLVKSPPGLCKTREAIDWAIRYQAEQEGKDFRLVLIADHNEAGVTAQTSIFVPRHQLAEELRELIEGPFESAASKSRCQFCVAERTGAMREKRLAGGGEKPVSWRAKGCRSTPISASASQTAKPSSAPTLLGASTSRRGRRLIARHS